MANIAFLISAPQYPYYKGKELFDLCWTGNTFFYKEYTYYIKKIILK